MDWTSIWFLTALLLVRTSGHEYHFINQSLSWPEAQSFCRLKHRDLATVRDQRDQRHLRLLLPPTPHLHWVGLRTSPTRRWRWSDGSGTLQEDYWAESEPNNLQGQDWCGQLWTSGKWTDGDCSDTNGFVCYELKGTDLVRFLLYSGTQSWWGAQHTCRENHVDLVSVTSPQTHAVVQDLVAGQRVWVGLFNDAWGWSDGSDTSYRHWGGGGGGGGGDCAAVSTDTDGAWAVSDCAERRPFVCEGGLKTRKTLVKIVISTSASLSSEVSSSIIAHLIQQLKNNKVSDFKLSWRNIKDQKVFQHVVPAPDSESVCDKTIP